MLSGVTGLVEEMVSLKRTLDASGYDLSRHEFFGGRGPNGTGSYPAGLVRLVKIVQNLHKKGILIKSLDEGLIDFPFVRSNGEEVYLCWKIGENEIHYWHPVAEGIAGRRPLNEL